MLMAGMNVAHGKPLAMVGPWEIHSVDPASNGVFFTRMQVAETLVEVDSQGNLQPGLASQWSSSGDGLQWRFTLRPGARFHDGSEVSAEQAAFALQQAWRQEARRLHGHIRYIPQMNSVRLFDARGELLFSTEETPRQINVADRAHFQRARDTVRDELVISEVVRSRSTVRDAVVLLRAVRAADGRFLGALSAPLDLSYFEPLLTDARLGPGSAAAIRRVDTGTLIVRQPAVPADADRASTDHPAHRLILAGQATGSSRHLSELDGIERIISFQRLEHFPLYTVVGIAPDTALGDWWRRSLASAALVAAALLSVVLFYRHMARSKRLLESVLEAASEVAIIATDRNGRVTLFNRGAENLLGHPAADAVGRMGLADLHLPEQLRLRSLEITADAMNCA